MKNIHILPTDKPSRLYKTGNFLLLDSKAMPNNTLGTINQYIYITSDEEIKEGDYGVIGEVIMNYSQMHKMWNMPQGKKIILTTDQDLINDGVQAIDDEFLEWFVKNSTCENIPIIMTTVSKESTYKTNIGFESWRKEEPSQDKRMYSEEEVLEILEHHTKYLETFIYQYIDKNDMEENKIWFEQYKKK